MRIARYLALGLALFALGAVARDDGSPLLAQVFGALAMIIACGAALAIVVATWGARG